MENLSKYGFYVPDDKGFRLNLNLTESTWNIINQDVFEFDNATKTGLINKIIQNYYEKSNASISERLFELEQKIMQSFPNEYNKKVFGDQSFINIIIKKEKERLLKLNLPKFYDENYVPSRLATIQDKIRIDINSCKILEESQNAFFYQHPNETNYCPGAGEYVKRLLEDYVSLPRYQREAIFYQDNVNRINRALNRENNAINKKPQIIEFSLKQKIKDNKTNDVYQRKFIVVPYELVHDDQNNFNYLIGIGKEVNPFPGEIDTEQILCFRLSKIDGNIKVKSALGYLSQKDINAIENEKATKGIQYLAGDIKEFHVKFTKKGIENLKNWVIGKPREVKKINDFEYIFESTDFQIRNYFLKFGNNAEIISPIETRKYIASVYYRGLSNYPDMEKLFAEKK